MVRDASSEVWSARSRAVIATFLMPSERGLVDVACGDRFALRHCDSLDAVRAALARGDVGGVLVSASRLSPLAESQLVAMAHDFPATTIVGLVHGSSGSRALASACAFGRAGAMLVIDAQARTGWEALRRTFSSVRASDAFGRRAAAATIRAIEEAEHGRRCTDGLVAFFARVFDPAVTTATELAGALGVMPPTLLSRFSRAKLPSPKRYVTYARLARLAWLAETPGLSVAALAVASGASGPQALQRTVRAAIGLSVRQLQCSYTGETMLANFMDTLIVPYREPLIRFDPQSPHARPRAHTKIRGVREGLDRVPMVHEEVAAAAWRVCASGPRRAA
jgi:AraC-like DNA-binding protein